MSTIGSGFNNGRLCLVVSRDWDHWFDVDLLRVRVRAIEEMMDQSPILPGHYYYVDYSEYHPYVVCASLYSSVTGCLPIINNYGVLIAMSVFAITQGVVRVGELCVERLIELLNLANIMGICKHAFTYNIYMLKNSALDFMAQNAVEVVDLPEFSELVGMFPQFAVEAYRVLAYKTYL